MRRTLTVSQKKIVAAEQAWQCLHCHSLLPASFEVDHVNPLWNGGTDERSNLVALCGTCHTEKTYRENSDRVLNRRRAGVLAKTPAPQHAPLQAPRKTSPYFDSSTEKGHAVSLPDALAQQLSALGLKRSNRG